MPRVKRGKIKNMTFMWPKWRMVVLLLNASGEHVTHRRIKHCTTVIPCGRFQTLEQPAQ